MCPQFVQKPGIDISMKESQSVFNFFAEGRLYDYVITVCDESIEDRCPIFPGVQRRLHWPFPDPSKITGTTEEQLTEIRKIRDSIRARIESWIQEVTE